MKKTLLGFTFFAAALLPTVFASDPPPDPRFNAEGQLLRPENYREWIFLSSGLGMNYGSTARRDVPVFDNVFVHPAAYKAFMATGKWPDKTMFVLELRASETHGSINKDGHFQSGVVAVEASVKDESRFKEKWAYFEFPANARTSTPFPQGRCWSCHNPNGGVDNTFVQFYPTLKPVAEAKGTFKVTPAPASSGESRP